MPAQETRTVFNSTAEKGWAADARLLGYDATAYYRPKIDHVRGSVLSLADYATPGSEDTTNIQAAINAAAAAGKALWIPPGVDWIAGQLTIPSNSYIFGAAPNSHLYATGNALGDLSYFLVLSDVTNVTIRDIKIKPAAVADGTDRFTVPEASHTGTNIRLDGTISNIRLEGLDMSYAWVGNVSGSNAAEDSATNVVLNNLYLHDSTGSGLTSAKYEDSLFTNIRIFRCGGSAAQHGNQSYAMYVQRYNKRCVYSDWVIRDCHAGIKWSTTESHDVLVQNFTIYNCVADPVYVADGTDYKRFTFSNIKVIALGDNSPLCRFWDCEDLTLDRFYVSTQYTGTSAAHVGINLHTVIRGKITNSIFQGNGEASYDMYAIEIEDGCQDILISDNHFKQVGRAISFDTGAISTHIRISNNVFEDFRNCIACHGSGCQYVYIEDNYFKSGSDQPLSTESLADYVWFRRNWGDNNREVIVKGNTNVFLEDNTGVVLRYHAGAGTPLLSVRDNTELGYSPDEWRTVTSLSAGVLDAHLKPRVRVALGAPGTITQIIITVNTGAHTVPKNGAVDLWLASNATLQHNANIQLAGGSDLTSGFVHLELYNGVWYEV